MSESVPAGDLTAEVAEFARTGFHEVLGLRYDRVTADRVEASVDVSSRHHQPMGLVHGGVYAALVESAASIGAWVRLRGSGDAAVGIHNATDFLRPHTEGRLRIVAEPVHVGRTQQLWQVLVSRDADGKVVARGQVRLQVVPGAEF